MKTKAAKMTDDRTLFRCAAPEATTVSVAGDFNDWSIDGTPMAKGGDGVWTVAVPIAAGRHEYKFVVDGEWRCEPDCSDGGAARCVPNPFGTMNSVVDVR